MINQVTMVGRLTKDPELRHTGDGRAVLNITMALNRPFKNKDGEYESDFIYCTLWNKIAENTARYCSKGSIVGITGRIQTRSYETEEKNRTFITEVIAEHIQFLSPRSQKDQDTSRQIPFDPSHRDTPQQQSTAIIRNENELQPNNTSAMLERSDRKEGASSKIPSHILP
ncbi:single-stranded DNA-binding protein [Bacillus coahuilensis]|uniref:single-stranded DNA-binding protein n=1 Tax=Bacillus coahuilensis TaxID=408580 RepID=UPI0009EB5FE9|nr:single-stranded DNA-binding protein [Bacillus coahuilensis]